MEQASTRHLGPTQPGSTHAQYVVTQVHSFWRTGRMGTLDRGRAPTHPASISWLIARPGWTRNALTSTTSRNKTLCACAHEEPRTAQLWPGSHAQKLFLRCANASLQVQCCDANIRPAARLRIRSLLEARGAHTNSITQATVVQESSSTVHVTVLPHTACPHVRCLVHGVWWEKPYCTCTVCARPYGDLWIPITNS